MWESRQRKNREELRGLNTGFRKRDACSNEDQGRPLDQMGNDLSVPLGRVESAGGKVILPKTGIGENRGFIALFIDTEGNKVGFHSVG